MRCLIRLSNWLMRMSLCTCWTLASCTRNELGQGDELINCSPLEELGWEGPIPNLHYIMSYSQIFAIFQAKRRKTGQMVARPRGLLSLGKVNYFGKKTIFSSENWVLCRFCTFMQILHTLIRTRTNICPSVKTSIFLLKATQL